MNIFSWSWFFRCTRCRKMHLRWTGTTCPCGEPFPYEHKAQVYR